MLGGSTDSLTSVLDHSSCESSHKDSPACNDLKVDNKDHCDPDKATSCQHNCPVSAFIRKKKSNLALDKANRVIL